MVIEPERSYGSWSGATIDRFLRHSHIPLRIGFLGSAGLLIVPVWYEYDDGRFLCCSPARSALVKGLRKNAAIAFDISTNEIPYKGVRGRGRAACNIATSRQPLEALLKKYLKDTNNELSQWLLSRTDDEAVIDIEIEWLTSWDFSARMGGATL
jgi:nitroimidazol reductase NimA-like FMN-containing flavoprotein (pyridoxamine 5'-phosphate oxidase superfamily)